MMAKLADINQSDHGNRVPEERLVRAGLIGMLALSALYWLTDHYVKAYADPLNWLMIGEQVRHGDWQFPRPPVYPVWLAWIQPLFGPVFVFLSNLPWLLLMTALVYGVTAAALRNGSGPGRRRAACVGLLAVGFLLWPNQRVYLLMLNPYREALAFTLLLAGVWGCLRFMRRETGLVGLAVAGLLGGLSVGARETCALVLLPLGLLMAVHAWRTRHSGGVKALLWLGLWVALGLLPFLVHNHVYSGRFWVPTYAAQKWQRLEEAVGSAVTNLPVPGMRSYYFEETLTGTLAHFYEKFRGWGIGFFFLGLGVAVWRRHLVPLLFFLPAMLLQLFFYAHYRSIMDRYLFAVELFLVPFMALGLWQLLVWITRCVWLRKRIPVTAGRAVGGLVLTGVLLMGLRLVWVHMHDHPRLKTWQLAEMRQVVIPQLDAPRSFLGDWHHRSMAAWFLQGKPLSTGNRIPWSRRQEYGVESTLHYLGTNLLHSASQSTLYEVAAAPLPLPRLWFDLEPVTILSDQVEHLRSYREGEPLQVYRSVPWTQRTVDLDLEVPEPGQPHMLLLDMKRMWDVPARSTCTLVMGDHPVSARLPNGLQALPLPDLAGQDMVHLTLESDAPLPTSPWARLQPINQALTLPLGMRAQAWAGSRLSEELLMPQPERTDGVYLLDHGTISVPAFAEHDREVYVEIQGRSVHNELTEGHPFRVSARTPRGTFHREVDSDAKAFELVFPLAPGKDRCEDLDVVLETGQPGLMEQLERYYRHEMDGFGGLLLTAVRVFSVPVLSGGSMVIDVGADMDGAYLLRGFHPRERSASGSSVRWTRGQAEIRLLVESRGDVDILVTLREARPEASRPEPVFSMAGQRLDAEKISGESEEVVYRMRVPGTPGEQEYRLLIEVPTWSPHLQDHSSDQRQLGVQVDRVEVQAVDPS